MEKVATRGQILWLTCTKFDFGWGSAPDPGGGARSAPPDPLAGFKGPTSKGEDGRGGKGREEEGKDRREGKRTPLSKCLRTGLRNEVLWLVHVRHDYVSCVLTVTIVAYIRFALQGPAGLDRSLCSDH